MSLVESFRGLVRKEAKDFFPEHVEVDTDRMIDDQSDALTVAFHDRSKDPVVHGAICIDGILLRSWPACCAAVRHELRALADKMGYPTVEERC